MAKISRKSKNKKTSDEDDQAPESEEDVDNDNKDFDDYPDSVLVQKLEKVDAKNKNTESDDIDYIDESEDDEDILEEIEPYVEPDEGKIQPEFIVNERIIPVNERTTTGRVSAFEYSSLITTRATMISLGNTPLVNVKNLDNEEDIAKLELISRKIPLLIKRHVGKSPKGEILIEIWDPKTMTLPTNMINISST